MGPVLAASMQQKISMIFFHLNMHFDGYIGMWLNFGKNSKELPLLFVKSLKYKDEVSANWLHFTPQTGVAQTATSVSLQC